MELSLPDVPVFALPAAPPMPPGPTVMAYDCAETATVPSSIPPAPPPPTERFAFEPPPPPPTTRYSTSPPAENSMVPPAVELKV
jgi:hypothetical protein